MNSKNRFTFILVFDSSFVRTSITRGTLKTDEIQVKMLNLGRAEFSLAILNRLSLKIQVTEISGCAFFFSCDVIDLDGQKSHSRASPSITMIIKVCRCSRPDMSRWFLLKPFIGGSISLFLSRAPDTVCLILEAHIYSLSRRG